MIIEWHSQVGKICQRPPRGGSHFRTIEEARAAIDRYLDRAGEHGGLILAAGNPRIKDPRTGENWAY